MKNISLILNVITLAIAGFLLYQNSAKKPDAATAMIAPPSTMSGVKIAYIDVDTLDAKYEWLKSQKGIIEQKVKNAEKTMSSKKDALLADMAKFQEKYESQTVAPAELQKEYEELGQRERKLAEEEGRLSKQLGDDTRTANEEMMKNLEEKLKAIQSQIGYDYILSYSKGGGQVLLANDSLNITKQVLELLNAKEEKK